MKIENQKYKMMKSFIIVMKEYFSDKWRSNIKNVISKSRKREFVLPRQIIFYIWAKCYGITRKYTGDYFGRDHSTVIHGIKTIEDYAYIDQEFKSKLNKILDVLNAQPTSEGYVRESIKVNQLNRYGKLIKTWNSTYETGKHGFNQSLVYECCIGNSKTHKGYYWEKAS